MLVIGKLRIELCNVINIPGSLDFIQSKVPKMQKIGDSKYCIV